jgi:hypothetical protein
MLLEIIIGIASFIVGLVIGKVHTGNATTERLRSRGYTIKHIHSYAYPSGWRFYYTGFDKKLNPILVEGQLFTKYADAVANANAHFYAKTIHGLDKAEVE